MVDGLAEVPGLVPGAPVTCCVPLLGWAPVLLPPWSWEAAGRERGHGPLGAVPAAGGRGAVGTPGIRLALGAVCAKARGCLPCCAGSRLSPVAVPMPSGSSGCCKEAVAGGWQSPSPLSKGGC